MMNDATQYGVTIQRATPNSTGRVWRALLVKHLEPHENGDNHHLYCDVYGEDGRELRGSTGVRVAWTWNGRRADEPAPPAPLEKPKPEHMANIPMNKGQIVSAWVDGFGYPSDIVAGLHTDHPDEGDDVRRGHHSFVVRFRKVLATPAQPPTPVQPPQPPAPDDERAGIAAGLRRVATALEGAAVDLRHLAAAAECQGEAKG